MKTFLLAAVLVLIGCGGAAIPTDSIGRCDWSTFEATTASHRSLVGWWDPFPQGGAALFVVESTNSPRLPLYPGGPYQSVTEEVVTAVIGEWHPYGSGSNQSVSCTNITPDVIQNNQNNGYFSPVEPPAGWPGNPPVQNGVLMWQAIWDHPYATTNPPNAFKFTSTDGLSWTTTQLY